MAVFTAISLPEFNLWAHAHYGLRARALTPISEGIENTNYRVSMEGDAAGADDAGAEYVFTLFELWDDAAVDYYTAFMQHLNAAALPVPAAVRGAAGASRHNWADKPCVLVPFVAGGCKPAPSAAHCEQMGALLAQMHIAAAGFAPQRRNPRNIAWRRETAQQVRGHLPAPLAELMDAALADDIKFNEHPLPAAACHCDLFRNNVLWQGDEIGAVIDFYFGGEDTLVFDIAVCACDWCYPHDDAAQGNDDFDADLLAALIGGYSRHRRLCALEKNVFIEALGSAALRFWLSRHYDIIFPRPAAQLTPHDPRRFERILRTVRDKRDALAQVMRAAA